MILTSKFKFSCRGWIFLVFSCGFNDWSVLVKWWNHACHLTLRAFPVTFCSQRFVGFSVGNWVNNQRDMIQVWADYCMLLLFVVYSPNKGRTILLWNNIFELSLVNLSERSTNGQNVCFKVSSQMNCRDSRWYATVYVSAWQIISSVNLHRDAN